MRILFGKSRKESRNHFSALSSARERYAGPFLIACAFYVIAIQIFYAQFIVPLWEYGGQGFSLPPVLSLISSYLIALIPAFFISQLKSKPSVFVICYLYFSVYVPAVVINPLNHELLGADIALIFEMQVALLIGFSLMVFFARLPTFFVPKVYVNSAVYLATLSIFVVLFVFVVLFYFGSPMEMRFTQSVIEMRMAGREIVSSLTGAQSVIAGYSLSYLGNVLCPLLAVIGLYTKRTTFIIIALVIQVIVFSALGGRGAFGNIIFIFALYFLLVRLHLSARMASVSLVFGVIIFSAFLFLIGDIFLKGYSSWLVNRAFVGPGHATGLYFVFSNENIHTYFSHVRGFEWVSINPYAGQSLGNVIGEWIGQPGNNINANLWADSFIAVGFFGPVIATVILSILLNVLDSFSRRIDLDFVILCVTSHALNLADIPVTTVAFGGGLLFLIVLLWFIPPRLARRRVVCRTRE
jgi:hypothetical protein